MRGCVLVCALLTATVAAAQSPKLEIGTRVGDAYWVVETAADGSRRGGWVDVRVPLDRIDRSAFKPLPAGPPPAPTPAPPQASTEAPTQSAPVAVNVSERSPRTEPAPAATQVARQEPQAPRVAAVAQTPDVDPRVLRAQQRRQRREGFWFNGGFGVGAAGCVGCVGREVGPSGGLSIGGTITPRLLLGVGTTGWYKQIDGVNVNGGTFDARLRFYPSKWSGFFVTGGAGIGSIAVWDAFDSARETGVGALFGLGWDVRVGRNVSLTPYYNGFAIGVTGGTFVVDQFGLGLTIH